MRLPSVFAGRRRLVFARLVGNGAAQGALAFATALVVRALVDGHLLASAATVPMWLLALALLSTGAGTAWLRRREAIDAEMLGQDYALILRERMLDVVTRLSPRSLGRRRKGGLLLRFVGDLSALRQWVSLGLARITVAGLMLTVSMILLALLSGGLAMAVSLVVIGGACATLWLGGRMDAAVRATRHRRSLLAGTLGETLAGLGTLQVFGQRRRHVHRVRVQARALRDALVGQARVAGGLQAVAGLTAAWGSAAVLLLGVWAARSGIASPGTVVAAMSVVSLMVAPIRNLGRVFAYWRAAAVASEKIIALLRLGPVLRSAGDARALRRGSGEISFDAATVDGALQPLSARIVGGSRVALVGPNGAGKSTVLNLIGRLLDPDTGAVRIDDQDLRRVHLDSLRHAVAWVAGELPLFRGNIEMNLRFRRPRATAEELAEVCHRCGLDALIARWPQGLATPVAEGGINLSTGERYRIMLARALLGAPWILLLDEADANLDAESRDVLDQVIVGFPGTVVIASHRPQTLGKVDAIWHMADGRLLAIECVDASARTMHVVPARPDACGGKAHS